MSRNNIINLEFDKDGNVIKNVKQNKSPSFPSRNHINNDKIEIESVLLEISETLHQIASARDHNNGNGGGGNMDLEARVSRLEESAKSIETTVARIDERTKRLDNMESILNSIRDNLSDFKTDIPKGDNIATKDFVGKEINKAKTWIIITAVGTGITLLGTLTSLIRLFIQ